MSNFSPIPKTHERRGSCDHCGHIWTITPDDMDRHALCPVCEGITDWREAEILRERMRNVGAWIVENAENMPASIIEDVLHPIIKMLNSRSEYGDFVQLFHQVNPDIVWTRSFDDE